MDDNISMSSKKSKTSGPSKDDAKREKKIRKVLKEALKAEKQTTAGLTTEVESLRSKNSEMESELKNKEIKYLDLYMENSLQHE